MSRCRLAYLCGDPGIPPTGSKGASVHFRQLAAALSAAGAEIDAFMARADESPAIRDTGDDAAPETFPTPLTIVAPRRRRGVLGELELIGNSARLARRLVDAAPHDAVYERFSLFGGAGLAYARTIGVPLLLEVNAPLWLEAQRYRELSLVETARAMALEVLRAADVVLTVSPRLRVSLIEHGVSAAATHVLGNGYDRAFATAMPIDRPAALRGRPMLLFVGSLKPWHGIEFLLRAFEVCARRMPLGLWIVGDGPLAGLVRDAASRHPHIVFDGPVQHSLMPSIVRAADGVVAPYTSDAPDYFSPLKVVEALAAERPLIASRTPCVVDSVGTESLPGLFAPGDVEDFCAAVARVIADPRGAVSTAHPARPWQHNAAEVLARIERSRSNRSATACRQESASD